MKTPTDMRTRLTLAVVWVGVGAALYHAAIREVAAFALHDDTFSYIVLIPLVSAFFLLRERKEIFSSLSFSPLAGGSMLAGALAVFFAGRALSGTLSPLDRHSVMMCSVVLYLIGGVTALLGTGVLRRGLFPLLFLLFAIPLPRVILNPVVTALQLGSSEAANIIFMLSGTEFLREGTSYHFSSMTITVAPECSGIRSGLALMVTSVVAGKLFLRRPWSRAALAAAVFPIAIVKNGCRIALLSLWAIHRNPAILHGSLHRQGGKPFFVLALVMLGVALWVIRRTENQRGRGAEVQRSSEQ